MACDPRDLFAAAPLPVARLGEDERLACLRLIRSENVGPATFRALINHFGGAALALEALPELSRRGGRRRAIDICLREQAEEELAAAAHLGAEPVFTIEPGYPAVLAQTGVPPPLLYIKGNSDLLGRPMLAIVGSRQCSAAGHGMARRLAADLGRSGLIIVSGLARGIDGTAHTAALATGTVGVLAGGIDVVYPPEHEALQRSVAERGCLVTERAPGLAPRGTDFPRRNRIIAGLALGVLVVEAARRSGSLGTARLALDYGREVFALPGHPMDPRAEGTNGLLKAGATLVTEAQDVIDVLAPFTTVESPVEAPAVPAVAALTTEPTQAERDRLLAALGPSPVDSDELARVAGLPPRSVQALLLELDLAGRIERHSANLVSLRLVQQ